mmetsp:Transcript_21142/g.54041  ORF Transcript_21142/g.54041 Transcript_21142/m.54041 type:complete len:254 (+) Transcript_21142:100-861(+)
MALVKSLTSSGKAVCRGPLRQRGARHCRCHDFRQNPSGGGLLVHARADAIQDEIAARKSVGISHARRQLFAERSHSQLRVPCPSSSFDAFPRPLPGFEELGRDNQPLRWIEDHMGVLSLKTRAVHGPGGLRTPLNRDIASHCATPGITQRTQRPLSRTFAMCGAVELSEVDSIAPSSVGSVGCPRSDCTYSLTTGCPGGWRCPRLEPPLDLHILLSSPLKSTMPTNWLGASALYRRRHRSPVAAVAMVLPSAR